MKTVPSKTTGQEAEYARSLVIHEDAHILVFNKPSGLAVQTRGNRGPCLENLLTAFARSNGKIPRLVHRIDAGTSGLLIAAKTKPAAAHFSEQFAKRRVRKTYLALVRGALPDAKAGTIDQPLVKMTGVRGSPPMAVGEGPKAQSAQTHYRIIASQADTALLELRPKTGRMHQIRAHLKWLSCPILGDPLYGAGKLSAPRLMLHALRLRLEGLEGDGLDFSVDPDGEMAAAIAALSRDQ